MRVMVVGGGVAGLSAAWALGRRGVRDVILLERAATLFAGSSGRNAAIFRPAERPIELARLALRTAELLDDALGGRAPWLAQRGLLLTARDPGDLTPLAELCEAAGLRYGRVDGAEVVRRAPITAGGHATGGLAVELGGVLDLHAIATGLERAIRVGGGRIELGASVRRVIVRAGRVAGVELAGGDELPAEHVVIAGGAWAGALGAGAGAPLPLGPVRRHLVQLEPERPVAPGGPTIWDAGLGSYFRPESGGVLASPADAEPWAAADPPADPAALELLWSRLDRMAPALAAARVRRSWACLRTFAPDHVSVIGADPRVVGLHWLAGLGGHGITCGAAAGELLAAVVTGAEHPARAAFAPARLL
ncbi:MAG: FAD-binding oxidoreductase [Polyangiaceae bacterium]|nr:FAD-binding oxidoreductase [Polyangiaceae bacterium]